MSTYNDPAMILPGSVTSTEIAAGAVDTTEIADDAVTTGKIAAGAVDTTEIADDAVTTGKIAAGADIAFVAYGSYTGNNTANRAIPHGLPKTPRFLRITREAGNSNWFMVEAGNLFNHDSSYNRYAVSSPDSTYFYVGNSSSYPLSANGSGVVYHWVVVA